MTAPDFAAILAARCDARQSSSIAAEQLATKVPELCQTCTGTATVCRDGAHGDIVYAKCPDCPTIGQLLAIGAAVVSAPEMDSDEAPCHYVGAEHFAYASGWNAAIDDLRTVQP